MNARLAAIGVLILSVVTRTTAHQLDEYLQATILSVEKGTIKADMFLTPGVAVLPAVLAEIDIDHDGVVSPTEQRTYAMRVLHDLSLTLDGQRLTPRLITASFPSPSEMKEGRGDIHLEFKATFPSGSSGHKLRLENHHQSSIAAYQVNSLLPTDPKIRLGAEHRNYSQSVYELEFTAPGPAHFSGQSQVAFVCILLFLLVMLACRQIATALRNSRPRWRLA